MRRHHQQQQPQSSKDINPHLTLRTTTLFRQGRSRRNTGGLSPNSWNNGTSAPVWDKPTECALASKTPYTDGFYSDENDDEIEDEYYMGRAVNQRNENFGRHRSASNFELRNRCPSYSRSQVKNDTRRRSKKQVRYFDEPALYVPPTSASDSDEPAVFVRARNV
jgi:hypothetical protein